MRDVVRNINGNPVRYRTLIAVAPDLVTRDSGHKKETFFNQLKKAAERENVPFAQVARDLTQQVHMTRLMHAYDQEIKKKS